MAALAPATGEADAALASRAFQYESASTPVTGALSFPKTWMPTCGAASAMNSSKEARGQPPHKWRQPECPRYSSAPPPLPTWAAAPCEGQRPPSDALPLHSMQSAISLPVDPCRSGSRSRSLPAAVGRGATSAKQPRVPCLHVGKGEAEISVQHSVGTSWARPVIRRRRRTPLQARTLRTAGTLPPRATPPAPGAVARLTLHVDLQAAVPAGLLAATTEHQLVALDKFGAFCQGSAIHARLQAAGSAQPSSSAAPAAGPSLQAWHARLIKAHQRLHMWPAVPTAAAAGGCPLACMRHLAPALTSLQPTSMPPRRALTSTIHVVPGTVPAPICA